MTSTRGPRPAFEDSSRKRDRRGGHDALVRAAAVVLSASSVLVGGLSTTAAAALPNPPSPGLPEFYVGIVQKPFDPPILVHRTPLIEVSQRSVSGSALASGQSDAKRAKLAIKLPVALTAVNSVTGNYRKPVYNPRNGKPSGTANIFDSYSNYVYLRSPAGTTPAWGVMPPTTVTTLAFGILPVKVTLHLSQPRENITASDRLGTPVPLFANVFQDYRPGQENIYDATVKGALELRLSDVTVDGRRIDVGEACRTVSTAKLSLVSKAAIAEPPPGSYSPVYGGDLYGTLSVPAFTGCRGASGEDLSSLFTNALTSDDTAIHLYQGALGQPDNVTCAEPALGSLACRQPKPLPLPTGPGQVPTTPPNWTPNLPPAPVTPLPNPVPTGAALP